MRLAEWQTRMRDTLLGPGGFDPALLARLADPPDQRERRLSVYRNNVRHALFSVLEAAFPVVRQLIGAECFTATALTFITEHPPQAPVLYAYGSDFADFLSSFRPLTELPWLADVARLEWARNEVLFAAESAALTPDQLATVPPEELGGLCIGVRPTTHWLASDWPIHAIWAAHQPDGPPLETVDLHQAESVMIWRRDGVVRQELLTAGESALLTAFTAGRPLAEVAEAGLEQDPALDFSAALARWLNESVLEEPIMDISLPHACGSSP
ncbi:MAG: putative DNA-binding domain-containing protein [Candidatus Competibacteraceae bacterium]|nr:putative DNA-binding domain-containing protein [Candidatus Competibacteraceae bacterium]HRY16147.1 DNA-binding domain-containing protein [Candidatus Competibacteraceae bacterium]